jgi:hypothetical protein
MVKKLLNSSLVKRFLPQLSQGKYNTIISRFLRIAFFLTFLLIAVLPLFWLVLLSEAKEYHLDSH